MALSRKERYATDPEYREREKKKKAERRRNRLASDPESRERENARAREYYHRKKAAMTSEQLESERKKNAEYMRIRWADKEFRERESIRRKSLYHSNIEANREYHRNWSRKNVGSELIGPGISLAARRQSGWRWIGAGDGRIQTEAPEAAGAQEWYDQWFDSLDDESAEPVWE